MRELPMLLNGHGVRATLAGTKTMTRRPERCCPWVTKIEYVGGDDCPWLLSDGGDRYAGYDRNPLGVPGDLLYVRETCRAEELEGGLDGVRYLADNAFVGIETNMEASDQWFEMWRYRGGVGLTVPSIHMPKWAARLWVRNTGVRVEHGPYISEEDAAAEGFEGYATYRTMPGEQFVQEPDEIATPAEEFAEWWAKQYPGMDWRFVTSYEVIEHDAIRA